jgi:hypothetical protein
MVPAVVLPAFCGSDTPAADQGPGSGMKVAIIGAGIAGSTASALIERGRVLVVSACSGHGHEFGAAVGRRTADAVETGDFIRYLRWLRAEPEATAHRSGFARRTGQDLETASS